MTEAAAAEGAFGPDDRIADLLIVDGPSGPPGESDLENERRVAIYDILEDNRFRLRRAGATGPFRLRLALRDEALRFDTTSAAGEEVTFDLPFADVAQAVTDYLAICEDYRDAIRRLAPSQIEALDQARRETHGEASDALAYALAAHVEMDGKTARRFFTLLCALRVGADA